MLKEKQFLRSVLNTLLPILTAFVIGAAVILFIGEDPLKTYGIMLKKSLFDGKGILKTLHFAAPLILTGLGIAITFKANLFNMGVEGQMLLGAFCAGAFGFAVELAPLPQILLCLTAGTLSGMLFALIPAMLKAYCRANEMVVTLMLNYVAIEVTKYLAQSVSFFRDPKSGTVSTYVIHDSAMFKKIGGYSITPFFFIALAVFVIIYIVMKKSKLGYELTAIGKNPEFAEASGMRVSRKIVALMLISGAVSGLAGAGWMMSEKFKFTTDFSGNPGLGWDGMLIALLGAHSPAGVFIAAIFYAALKTGSESININTDVPKDIVGVIQGVLILSLSIQFINERTGFLKKLRRK